MKVFEGVGNFFQKVSDRCGSATILSDIKIVYGRLRIGKSHKTLFILHKNALLDQLSNKTLGLIVAAKAKSRKIKFFDKFISDSSI